MDFIEALKKITFRKNILLWLLITVSHLINAQTNNDSIKTLIAKLQSENNITAINHLINKTTSLEIDYTFSLLNSNLKTAENIKNFEALADTYLSLGNFWFMRGNKIKAYENYRKCEIICRENGFEKTTGLALMNASNVSSNMDKRISKLKSAVPYFEKSKDYINLTKAYLNIGSCYTTYILGPQTFSINKTEDTLWNKVQNDTILKFYRDSAFVFYNMAKKINDSLQHPELSGSFNLRIAQWLKFDENYDSAQMHYQLSAKFFNQANLYKGTVYCLLELSSLKMHQNLISEALLLADSTLQLANKFGFADYYSDACLLMAEIYEKTNNHDKALHYFKLYYNNSLKGNANLTEERISALNLELTIKEHENTINTLIQQSKINRLILLLIIIFTLFVLVACYLFLQNRKRKIKYITESLHKAEELNAIQIKLLNIQLENKRLHAELLEEKVSSRSENLVLVANKIQKLKKYFDELSEAITLLSLKLPPEIRMNELKPIKLTLMNIAHEQSALLEIGTLSKQINQDFFFYLEKNFSGLTKEDNYLLSMLITDLNSKQIAEYLNISPDSVFKKRYRLRKKLNITNETSFSEFYKNIIRIISTSE